MSVIFVLVGQCGTQVGSEICRGLPVSERTHHADGFVRAVGVDTEPKVIAKLFQDAAPPRTGSKQPPAPPPQTQAQQRGQAPPAASIFRRSSFVWEESGRGNNWAFGYAGVPAKKKEPSPERKEAFTTKWVREQAPIAERAMACVEEEIRRAGGFVEALVFVHSLAGGTGSGLGSRLLEECRKAYGEEQVLHFLSVVVAPHGAGDTAVASLNSLLTYSHLLRYSSLVLCFNNQQVSDQLLGEKRRDTHVRRTRGAWSVALSEINTHIATAVLLLLQRCSTPFAVSQLVTTLAPHPCHKVALVGMRTAQGEGWGEVLRQALKPFVRLRFSGLQLSVSSWAEEDSEGAAKAIESVATDAARASPHAAAWLSAFGSGVVECGGAVGERSIVTAVTSPQTLLQTLVPVGNQAGAKIHVGAYLHWYAQHGVGDRYFEAALGQIRDVVEANQAYLRDVVASAPEKRMVGRRVPLRRY